MQYGTFTPPFTPKTLKVLLLMTATISLAGAFSLPLQRVLALSWQGISQGYLWQLLSYLFIYPAPQGIDFSFLIQVAFPLYLLWTFGNLLLSHCRTLTFLTLYFGAGIVAGGVALATFFAFPLSPPLMGITPALYAVLVSWMLLNPHSEVLLFFILPLKMRWAILGLIGIDLALHLFHGSFALLTSHFTGALFGYLFALCVWKCSCTSWILEIWRSLLQKGIRSPSKKAKIYDIHSGQPQLDDEEFMDTMLSKISSQGEASLTENEKKRMRSISERKASQKQ